MKLYELAQNYLNLQELLENEEIGEEIIEAALKKVKGSIEEKAENYAIIIKNLEAQAEICEKEERRLANKKIVLRNKAKKLKNNLEECMMAIGKPKIKGKLFSFTIQNNAPSVSILDERLIPEEFIKTERVVVKQDILNVLKTGKEVQGAALKQSKSLRIR